MNDHSDEPKRIAGETPKRITGEIISSASVPTATPLVQKEMTRPKVISSAMDVLRSYADQRRWEADTNRKHAIAENIKGQRKIAVQTEKWLIMEERLKNLPKLKQKVSVEIETDLREMEARLADANRKLKMARLTEEAEGIELEVRILEGKLNLKRLQEKIDGNEESVEDLLSKAEAERESIVKKYGGIVEDKGELTDNEEIEYSQKYAAITDRIANLEEQRNRQDAGADS